jgi:hypothetical protein
LLWTAPVAELLTGSGVNDWKRETRAIVNTIPKKMPPMKFHVDELRVMFPTCHLEPP